LCVLAAVKFLTKKKTASRGGTTSLPGTPTTLSSLKTHRRTRPLRFWLLVVAVVAQSAGSAAAAVAVLADSWPEPRRLCRGRTQRLSVLVVEAEPTTLALPHLPAQTLRFFRLMRSAVAVVGLPGKP
jgi:hypothetical protein